jgi:hypothetical protein
VTIFAVISCQLKSVQAYDLAEYCDVILDYADAKVKCSIACKKENNMYWDGKVWGNWINYGYMKEMGKCGCSYIKANSKLSVNK